MQKRIRTSPPQRSFGVLSLALSLLLAASATVTLAMGAIETTPTQPIYNMPFFVSSTDVSVSSVFLSRGATCSAADTISGTTQQLAAPSYRALYNLATLGVTDTRVYVCQYTGGASLQTIDFEAMTFAPRFFIQSQLQTIQFSANVPVGTRATARQYQGCTGDSPVDVNLSPSRTITAMTSSSFIYFMCVLVTGVDNVAYNVNLGTLISTVAGSFSPTSVVRNTIGSSFEVGGTAPPNSRVIIAPDSNCQRALQGPIASTGTFGKTFPFTVTVPASMYAFCVENPPQSTIFVPSDTQLTVQEYTVSPLTIFGGISVPITFGGAIPASFALAWASSSDCARTSWLDPTAMTVTTSAIVQTFSITAGQPAYTLYSCIYKDTTDANANRLPVVAGAHQIVQPYTAAINRPSNDIVRGLALKVTVAPHPNIFVSLHLGTGCGGTAYASGNASNFVFSTLVPIPTTVAGPTTVCLRTLDGTATYAVLSGRLRDFVLSYDVVVAGLPTRFGIDTALATGYIVEPAFKFSVGNMDCSGADAGGFGVMPAVPNVTLTFPSPGLFTFCARSYSLDFVPIAAVQAYVRPYITPNATLTGVSTLIDVMGVAVGVLVVVGRTCDVATADHSQVRSASLGSVPFTVQYPTAGYRLVCAYLSSTNGTTAPFIAGNLTISGVAATPTKAFQGQRTRFNIVTTMGSSPPYMLNGAFAYVSTLAVASCPTGSSNTPVAINYNNGRPFVNLDVPVEYPTVSICVGGTALTGNAYVFAGFVTVIPGLTTAFDPSPPVVGVPFSIAFSGSYYPESFAIATESAGCEAPIISGPLSSGATTVPVTVQSAGSYIVCVEADPPGTFLVATALTISELEASPSTYVRFTSTFLGTLPALSASTAQLFLTSATDCTGMRWTATPAAPLSAPVGLYVLCALINSGGGSPPLAIARNSVRVIDAYKLTLPPVPPPIRSFIPFVISLLGGDVASVGSATVFFVPKTSPTTGAALQCYNTSITSPEVVSRATSSVPSAMTVVIPARENVPYRLCAVTGDGTSAVELTIITPQSYVSPAVVIKGVTTSLTSGGMATGYAIIAQSADCSGSRYSGPIAVSNFLMDRVTVSSAVGSSVGYYCESNALAGTYNYRATVALVPFVTLPPLPPPSTYPPSTPIGFEDRTVPPATPVLLQVAPEMGSRPFVSYFRNCSKVVVGITTVGYIPAESEDASFYVCARAPDGNSNFSMPSPNLHISKYVAAPTSALSGTPTTLSLVPPAASSNAWFSSDAACPTNEAQPGGASYLGAAVDFASGYQPISTPYVGIVYICAIDSRAVASDPTLQVGRFVPIASVLSVGAPTLGPNSATNPILGIPWCLQRSVPKGLYTLIEGDDAGLPYARYYVSTNRNVFIVRSSEQCAVGNALTSPVSQTGSEDAQLCLPTATLANGSYTVCSGTPAGFVATVTATMTVANPSPSAWVAGTNTLTYFPNMPERSFMFVPSGQPCAVANAASLPFTTNGSSYALVSTFSMTGGVPMPAGTYTLCAKVDQSSSNSAWTAVKEGLAIHRQQRYSLGVTTLTAGVATTVPLGGDLTVGVLRARLSPAAAAANGGSQRAFAPLAALQSDADSFISPCQTELSASSGTVAPTPGETSTSATHALITIPAAGRYVVCALTAVNNSMVPVATITVVAPVVSFAGEIVACDLLTVMYPSLPAAAQTQTTDMFLSSELCCTPNASITSSATLAVIPKPAAGASPLLRSVSVSDDDLLPFRPTKEFSLCVLNATFCVGAGHVAFVDTICGVTTLTAPANGNGTYTGGAATGWKLGRDNIPVTLLVIFFCLLLCCLIIIAIICCCRRNRKVTPKEEPEAIDGIEMIEDASPSRRKAVRGRSTSEADFNATIAIPMDMGLYLCSAPPIGAQIVENDEGRYRAIVAHLEAEARADLYAFSDRVESEIAAEDAHAFALREQERRDREELMLLSAARERSERRQRELSEAREMEARAARAAYESRMSEIFALLAIVESDEEPPQRLLIEEEEDTRRLGIAEMERELWRHHMEREGQLLHSQLEASHFHTRSRRRKLREANDRAFGAINETAATLQQEQQQQYGMGSRSSAALSPIRARSASRGGSGVVFASTEDEEQSNNPFIVVDDFDARRAHRYDHHSPASPAAPESPLRSPRSHSNVAVSLDASRPASVAIASAVAYHRERTAAALNSSASASGSGGGVYYAPPAGVAPSSALRGGGGGGSDRRQSPMRSPRNNTSSVRRDPYNAML